MKIDSSKTKVAHPHLKVKTRVLEGATNAAGMRFAIVVSKFNDVITETLLTGAMDALIERGADPTAIVVMRCPGAFEIPLVAQEAAATGRFDAAICLGCVIRGETPHFDYVAGECAAGVLRASLDSGIPVTFGVLTTDDVPQAEARAGGKDGNKGADAALTAIEMVSLLRQLESDE